MKNNRRISIGMWILLIACAMSCSKRSRPALTNTKQPEAGVPMGCHFHPVRFFERKDTVGVALLPLASILFLDMKEPESKLNLKILKEALQRNLPVCITLGKTQSPGGRITKVTLVPVADQ